MSLRIEQIDKRFAASEALVKRFPTIKMYELTQSEAKVYGLHHTGEDGVFSRMPVELADSINPSISTLSRHTAGGRIRFRTDSPFVAIRAKRLNGFYMRHMPLSGSTGCDIIVGRGKDAYTIKMCAPIRVDDDWFEDGEKVMPKGEEFVKEMRDITVTLPLYGGLSEFYIGIDENSTLLAPEPYTHGKVAFYGSSVTQGGCATRSGNSFDVIISRMMDCDVHNLGFSGSGKGEPEVAHYIASLDLAAFVMDYDHNAPNPEHLEATHKPFFEIIRAAHPELPVIFMSRVRPETSTREESNKRREIIKATYLDAVAKGDKNVYFIDGETVFPKDERDFCTVDGAHPNDLGFMYMAKAIMPYLRKVFGEE